MTERLGARRAEPAGRRSFPPRRSVADMRQRWWIATGNVYLDPVSKSVKPLLCMHVDAWSGPCTREDLDEAYR
jgi:hypothetical protein